MAKSGHRAIRPYFSSERGELYLSSCEKLLANGALAHLEGRVKLVFTSPPFPLNRKKKYGNLQGDDYVRWLSSLAPHLRRLLTPDGSIVVELGNAWNPGSPTASTLPLESLLAFKRSGALHLCQEFIYFNPARLPSPVQWVNKERIRVKDSFTRLWWLSPTVRPDADNRRVLVEYSDRMKKLLSSRKYNSGRRPSEHVIGENSFLRNNGGAIPPNVIVATNTKSRDSYLEYCAENGLTAHPARMPEQVVTFFVKFLTGNGDLVLDPFAGSNMTGAVAERYGRRWIAIELNEEYAAGSMGRFQENMGRRE